MPGFSDFNLSPALQFTLQELGYTQATPIQQQAIPIILQGEDLLAEAQTGTGKTASFALPMIEMLSRSPAAERYRQVRGLVLAPTRELAIQVAEATQTYSRALGLRVIAVYGGVPVANQIRKLQRGADILVATPGRLLDLLKRGEIKLSQLEYLVLDEADRMLDLGFIDPIQKIMDYAADTRQTLLFTATADDSVEVLAEFYLNNPKKIKVTPRNSTASQVRQYAYAVDQGDKSDVLSYLISEGKWGQTLVFVRTKKRVDEVTEYLQREGINAAAIHGDKTQRERLRMLDEFISGELHVLVATDVAARGLDIEGLPHVVNYDLPNVPEAYVHRIGRTGRAGETGDAVSLVSSVEREFLNRIEKLIKQKIKIRPVPRVENGRLVESEAAPDRPKKKTRKSAKKAAKPAAPAYERNTEVKAVRPSLLSKKK